MENTRVTVVCITYNHEKYISQALDSFVMQKTDFPFNVIISDDCSTDKTQNIIKEYANKYPEIIKPIFQKKNLGSMKNYIKTLSKVKSEYVIYNEGDDYFTDPLKLQKQVDFLDKHPDYSICFHKVRVFFEDGTRADETFPSVKRRFNKTTLDLHDIINNNFMQTNSVMYRWRFNNKEKIQDIFPKNIMPGDWFLHILHAQKGKIGFIDETMADYRRHSYGIWWESSQNIENIHLKFGIQELNFYLAVKKILIYDNRYDIKKYHEKLIYHAKEFLLIYLKNKKFEETRQIIELCPDVFSENYSYDPIYMRKKLKQYKKRNLILIISIILIVLFLTVFA